MLSLMDLHRLLLNTSRVILLKHILDLQSVVLIAAKLDNIIDINWFVCILPTILNDIITIRLNIWKYIHYNYMNSLFPRVIDSISIMITKIFLCIILLSNKYSLLIIVVCPLVISIIVSSLIRLTIVYNKTRYEVLNTITVILIQLIFKIIQPLLIIFNINGYIKYNYADIFIPLWLLTFFGVAISIVLTTCKPLLHSDGSVQIRDQALKLLNITIFQISAMSSCTLISLVWVCQKFDYDKPIKYFKMMSPIIVLYIVFIILDPIILNASALYYLHQEGVLHQDYQAALVAARSKQSYFETLSRETWLVQVSYNTYNEIEKSLELEAMILRKVQLPIIIYDLIDTIEMCVLAYAKKQENSRNMLFSESANNIAKVLSERRLNSIPIGQYGADHSLYNESISRSNSSDSHSDLDYVQCSTDDNDNNNPIVNQVGVEIEVSDVNECVICFQNAPDSCLNCGHSVMCFNCAVIVSKNQPNLCPICRCPISKLIKITSFPIVLQDNRTIVISSQSYSVQNKLAVAYMRIDREAQRQRIANIDRGNEVEMISQMDSLTITV